ncbi:MAG TPA: rhomboid family intramembrane serine protease [Chitinophagaceae bacterium]|nr:rhomboid family intramembrane serine protease [Chitinophagaceae bacterium]
MELSITLIIIIVTTLVSISGFSSQRIINDLIFYPPAVTHQKQWWRFLTCGLIHADFGHLILNMYALYIFGVHVERAFISIFGQYGNFVYLLMYISALIVCLLPTYRKNRNNYYYRSLGASGAVSAVVFCFILLFPLQKLGLIFFPVMIPGFIFGAIYLIVSSILDRRSADNINHSAHIWGALYGLVFLIVAANFFSTYPVLQNFIQDVQGWLASF